LSDGLVTGAHHSLNNRLAALGGIVQILSLELPPDHRLRQPLEHELERMRESVATMAFLAGGDEGEDSQPIVVGDALRDALTLYGLHHRLRDIPCDVEASGDLPPVRLPPARLARTLLMLMAAAARQASRVNVDVTAGAGTVTIRMGRERAAHLDASPDVGGDLPTPAEAVAAVAWIESFGGRIEHAPGDGLFTLYLPALTSSSTLSS
jgi:signal transduction histidine kinase